MRKVEIDAGGILPTAAGGAGQGHFGAENERPRDNGAIEAELVWPRGGPLRRLRKVRLRSAERRRCGSSSRHRPGADRRSRQADGRNREVVGAKPSEAVFDMGCPPCCGDSRTRCVRGQSTYTRYHGQPLILHGSILSFAVQYKWDGNGSDKRKRAAGGATQAGPDGHRGAGVRQGVRGPEERRDREQGAPQAGAHRQPRVSALTRIFAAYSVDDEIIEWLARPERPNCSNHPIAANAPRSQRQRSRAWPRYPALPHKIKCAYVNQLTIRSALT